MSGIARNLESSKMVKMEPSEFIRKWEKSTLKESAAAQSHFNDLCDLLGEPKPTDADQTGETYTFEKGATKSTGGQGFADVWKKGCFGWEYKGPQKDLNRAHEQLLRYSVALENPPLLIVSDTKTIIIRTNWTNTIQETHEIALTDLVDAGKRDLLKAAFENPEVLKPKRTRTQLTAEAADEFSDLAQRLRARLPDGESEHEYARKVAHFVNRLVFCMFAEDVGLLPNKLFQRALERSVNAPEKAQGHLQRLFAAMKDGGEFGLEDIPWFNGGLFDSDEALHMDRDDVALALKASKLDWQDIDPSILGTLFERGLDPSKRSQLGAHYTDREKIMMIVNPVIVEPLTKEWEDVKPKMEVELAKAEKAKSIKGKQNARKRATALHAAFIERLKNFRVLDPACGSGNFLYLSLLALKDIEHKSNLDAETLGLARTFPEVGPESVKGIEINPYAAELARVSIWIGEIQWMRRNGFPAAQNPILRPLGSIECRDSILTKDCLRATWPEADVVVGNPPFLGNKKMIRELGEDYVFALRKAWGTVPGGVDLVAYWFAQSWELIRSGRLKAAGLVSTNSIRGGANREVILPIVENGRIFEAKDDEEWTVDGAAVRVSLVCFDSQKGDSAKLNGEVVYQVYSDLTADIGGVDITHADKLPENQGISFQGPVRVGPFNMPGERARELLMEPRNANGKHNRDVMRPIRNGSDITRRPRDEWLVDFFERSKEDAAYFEKPFGYVEEFVQPFRQTNRRAWRRENWWTHGETGVGMREALRQCSRMIATPQVAKHRVFAWLDKEFFVESTVIVFVRDDDTSFGILHSIFHELWSLRMCTWLGKGNDPRYTPTTCFETFPFPEGLTPDIPATDYANNPHAISIAEAAARLDELRENWLNPSDLVKRVPEVVEGYPDRILPLDEKAEKILKKRTLTNLYNEGPTWLKNAHRSLNEAVAAAYGWEDDFKAGALTDEEILKRLYELNQERANVLAKS